MKAVYALYSDPDLAQCAVNSLKRTGGSLGISEQQIVVVSAEPFDGYDFSEEHSHTRIYLLAALGGLVGGILGFWFTHYSQYVYPLPTGGMPLAPYWTNGIVTYETTMLGAMLTTVITFLVAAKLPRFGYRLSDPEIWNGKILVGVANPPEKARPEVEKQLRLAGPAQIKTIS